MHGWQAEALKKEPCYMLWTPANGRETAEQMGTGNALLALAHCTGAAMLG